MQSNAGRRVYKARPYVPALTPEDRRHLAHLKAINTPAPEANRTSPWAVVRPLRCATARCPFSRPWQPGINRCALNDPEGGL